MVIVNKKVIKELDEYLSNYTPASLKEVIGGLSVDKKSKENAKSSFFKIVSDMASFAFKNIATPIIKEMLVRKYIPSLELSSKTKKTGIGLPLNELSINEFKIPLEVAKYDPAKLVTLISPIADIISGRIFKRCGTNVKLLDAEKQDLDQNVIDLLKSEGEGVVGDVLKTTATVILPLLAKRFLGLGGKKSTKGGLLQLKGGLLQVKGEKN